MGRLAVVGLAVLMLVATTVPLCGATVYPTCGGTCPMNHICIGSSSMQGAPCVCL